MRAASGSWLLLMSNECSRHECCIIYALQMEDLPTKMGGLSETFCSSTARVLQVLGRLRYPMLSWDAQAYL